MVITSPLFATGLIIVTLPEVPESTEPHLLGCVGTSGQSVVQVAPVRVPTVTVSPLIQTVMFWVSPRLMLSLTCALASPWAFTFVCVEA